VGTEKRERQKANRQLKYQQQAKQQHRATSKRRALIAVGAVVGGLAVVLGLAWVGGAFSGDDDTADTVATIDSTLPAELAGFRYGTGECPPEEGVDEPVKSFDDAPAECIDPAASYTATFVTSMGDIVADLDTAGVPGTVNNFVTLARYGYYDDTLIFRADPSIDIIQGGGVTNSDSPGYNIPDEADGFTYEPGQLVMARTAQPDSAGGQWFFVGGPNAAALDAQGTYVVFGEVTEGLEIVQSIIASVSANGPPPEEVRVETVTITEGGAEEPDATTTTG
jgi:cyclophilin family peptidyl-prolyl cis-trans isomerase